MILIKVRSQIDRIMDELRIPDVPYELLKRRHFPSINVSGKFDLMPIIFTILIENHELKPTNGRVAVTKTELRQYLIENYGAEKR